MSPYSSTKTVFVGPHEGRELELMIAGTKPLSMFVEPIPREFEAFPEAEFDALVSRNKLIKVVSMETVKRPDGKDGQVRRILYTLPDEEWRIKSLLLVQNLYFSLTPGWRPDLDRVIGLLLGYERKDIESFLESRGLQRQ
jgi:hypothetical protein